MMVVTPPRERELQTFPSSGADDCRVHPHGVVGLHYGSGTRLFLRLPRSCLNGSVVVPTALNDCDVHR